MSKYVGKIVTNQAPAGYSVFFDGNADFLTTASNAAFAFGTGDYTIEAWIYPTSIRNGENLIYVTDVTQGTSFGYNQTQLYIGARATAFDLQVTYAVQANTWTHVAASRQSGTVRIFANGVLVGSGSVTRSCPQGPAGIGDYPSATGFGVTGYISNVRVLKGTALYTAAFTPPTQLFNVTNTSLLTCNSPAIVDQSSNAFAITTNGSAAVSTFTPFTAYNPAPTSSNPLTPAPGVWTLDEALQYTQQGVWPSYAVNAIEDVFSTYLYTGTGATQTITNGVNLSGQGGMVWLKGRSGATDHALYDTARGATFDLVSNSTAAQTTQTTGLTAFNSNGFSIGALAKLNTNAATYTSWTFRKQAKFFDVVTYTGNGALSRTISHNLGSTPGFIIIKETSQADDWCCLARDSSGNYQYLFLNNTAATQGSSSVASTATSTTVDLGVIRTTGFALNQINEGGFTYVMYLFAHDAGGFGPAGTDNVISCGSVTNTTTVNLGYEPQWIMVKRTDSTSPWYIVDNMRGMNASYGDYSLSANSAGAETLAGLVAINATGMTLAVVGTYIYIAIRRGPMRPPTTGTSVFSPTIWTGNTPNVLDTRSISGFGKPTDLFIGSDRDTVYNHNLVYDRLRGTDSTGGKLLYTHNTSTEATNANSGSYSFAQMDGITLGNYVINYSGRLDVGWFFGRAPGFFDVVCYTGTGSALAVNHNLQVVPELVIWKARNQTGYGWKVTCVGLTNPDTYFLTLNATNAQTDNGANFIYNRTATTVTFAPDLTNAAYNNVVYLFATVAGVSKVGSYTGTGALQTINCGFAAGARFVLIKRTDSTGDWYVYDSARGITSGNDPYLFLNSTAAEVTNTNYVDTASTGFQVTAAAPAGLNANGGTYIFLAIA